MTQKSILYIITKSVWGGAAKYVYDLATNLPKNEFKVFVAAGGQGKFAKKIAQAQIPYVEISNFQRQISFFREFFAFFEILSLLFRLKPDIIHVNSSKAGSVVGGAAWVYKIFSKDKLATLDVANAPRLIFTAHGWAFSEDRPRLQIILIKLVSKLTSLFYHKIICVSEYDRKTALKNKIAPARKLRTIHNGIDFEAISFLSREEAQKRLINKTSPLVIGTIAEWTKNKGLKYLLEAISGTVPLLRGTVPEIVLIGSGENPDKEEIQKLIEKHPLKKNIHLIEFVENAASYLRAFNIFILPSVKEGLPYVILEAISAETPVIATRVGGIPEILSLCHSERLSLRHSERISPRHSERQRRISREQSDPRYDDFLVQPKNSRQLAERIVYFIDNSEMIQEMIKKTRQKAKQEFSLERMVKETKLLYF